MTSRTRAQQAKVTGRQGEDFAVRYLQNKGYRILAQNWRHGQLELDIICQEQDTLVFVEVKTRAKDGMAEPTDALTPRKRAAFLRAVQAWISTHDAWEKPCRLDVIAVYAEEPLTLEHFPHAITFTSAMGSGNAAWQPW